MAKWNKDHGKALVCVHWLDAHGSATQAYTEAGIPHKPFPMKSIGLLLKEDEVGVSIGTETYWDDVDQVMTFRGYTFIPRGMVVRIEYFKGGPKKAKVPSKALPLLDGLTDQT